MSAPDQAPIIPLCPHCAKELAALGLYNWATGTWVILTIYCGECRKTLHFQIVPVAAMPAESRPRVATPH